MYRPQQPAPGIRGQASGFGLRAQGYWVLGLRGSGSGVRVWAQESDLMVWAQGSEIMVWVRFQVSGFGLGVQG